jgi:hypothetical protein
LVEERESETRDYEGDHGCGKRVGVLFSRACDAAHHLRDGLVPAAVVRLLPVEREEREREGEREGEA